MFKKIVFIFIFFSFKTQCFVNVESENDFQDLLKNNNLIIVDFHAESWCKDSKKFKPLFTQLEKKYSKKLKFAKVDTDKLKKLTKEYKIDFVPTVIIFKLGKKVAKLKASNKQNVENKIKDLLKK